MVRLYRAQILSGREAKEEDEKRKESVLKLKEHEIHELHVKVRRYPSSAGNDR